MSDSDEYDADKVYESYFDVKKKSGIAKVSRYNASIKNNIVKETKDSDQDMLSLIASTRNLGQSDQPLKIENNKAEVPPQSLAPFTTYDPDAKTPVITPVKSSLVNANGPPKLLGNGALDIKPIHRASEAVKRQEDSGLSANHNILFTFNPIANSIGNVVEKANISPVVNRNFPTKNSALSTDQSIPKPFEIHQINKIPEKVSRPNVPDATDNKNTNIPSPILKKSVDNPLKVSSINPFNLSQIEKVPSIPKVNTSKRDVSALGDSSKLEKTDIKQAFPPSLNPQKTENNEIKKILPHSMNSQKVESSNIKTVPDSYKIEGISKASAQTDQKLKIFEIKPFQVPPIAPNTKPNLSISRTCSFDFHPKEINLKEIKKITFSNDHLSSLISTSAVPIIIKQNLSTVNIEINDGIKEMIQNIDFKSGLNLDVVVKAFSKDLELVPFIKDYLFCCCGSIAVGKLDCRHLVCKNCLDSGFCSYCGEAQASFFKCLSCKTYKKMKTSCKHYCFDCIIHKLRVKNEFKCGLCSEVFEKRHFEHLSVKCDSCKEEKKYVGRVVREISDGHFLCHSCIKNSISQKSCVACNSLISDSYLLKMHKWIRFTCKKCFKWRSLKMLSNRECCKVKVCTSCQKTEICVICTKTAKS